MPRTPEEQAREVAECIVLEKKLCVALGRAWTPSGFSLVTLIDDACREITESRKRYGATAD